MRTLAYLIVLCTLAFASDATAEPRLHYVTTAEQHGIVGYRDPFGVISPDGEWLAYSEGRFLKVQRIDGGPIREFEPLKRDIRYIAWLPGSDSVAILDRRYASEPARWFVFNIEKRQKQPLWPGVTEISGVETGSRARHSVAMSGLQYLTWSPDGAKVAGVSRMEEGSALWTINGNGGDAQVQFFSERLRYPAFHPGDNKLACLSFTDAAPALNLHCAEQSARSIDGDVYGPVAFSRDGDTFFYATPNEHETLDLWSRSMSGEAKRLTNFNKDAYAPSVDEQGRVLFKVKTYRPRLAMVPAGGGPTKALTTFQSETPSWDWTGKQIGFTYGTWRSVVDDFKYPDIAQEVGIINLDKPLPAAEPHSIVSASTSEDQAQHWSPNGKWITFHSHYGPSDDIWLVPADQSKEPWQITDGTYEAGWPRWSRDGKSIVYTGQKGEHASSRMFVIGMDQDTGEITRADREVLLQNYTGEVGHAEWASNSSDLIFESIPEPGKKEIYRVSSDGGVPKLIHAFNCEEKLSGIGASPKGDWIAYVAPGPGGYQQVYRVPADGGEPHLVTTDPTNKTQPSFSPDGENIAFTVLRYEVQFWLVIP